MPIMGFRSAGGATDGHPGHARSGTGFSLFRRKTDARRRMATERPGKLGDATVMLTRKAPAMSNSSSERGQSVSTLIDDGKNSLDWDTMSMGPNSDPALMDQYHHVYKTIQELGRGSAGKVYSVQRTSDKRLFAFKKIRRPVVNDEDKSPSASSSRKSLTLESGELHPNAMVRTPSKTPSKATSMTATSRTRKSKEILFVREAAMGMTFNHPHIAKIYKVAQSERYLYFVSEVIPGVDLVRHVEKRGPIPEAAANKIFRQMLEAVAYVHANHVVHRDIKLENFRLDDRTGRVVMLDFGLASFYLPDEMLKQNCGSPAYAAPEIHANVAYHGPGIDVWSLGVSLYAMCAAQLPWPTEHHANLGDAIRTKAWPAPRAVWSFELSDLISGMLEKDPAKRMTIKQIAVHPWMCQSQQRPVKMTGFAEVFSDDFAHEQLHSSTVQTYQILLEHVRKRNHELHHTWMDGGLSSRPGLTPVIDKASHLLSNLFSKFANSDNPPSTPVAKQRHPSHVEAKDSMDRFRERGPLAPRQPLASPAPITRRTTLPASVAKSYGVPQDVPVPAVPVPVHSAHHEEALPAPSPAADHAAVHTRTATTDTLRKGGKPGNEALMRALQGTGAMRARQRGQQALHPRALTEQTHAVTAASPATQGPGDAAQRLSRRNSAASPTEGSVSPETCDADVFASAAAAKRASWERRHKSQTSAIDAVLAPPAYPPPRPPVERCLSKRASETASTRRSVTRDPGSIVRDTMPTSTPMPVYESPRPPPPPPAAAPNVAAPPMQRHWSLMRTVPTEPYPAAAVPTSAYGIPTDPMATSVIPAFAAGTGRTGYGSGGARQSPFVSPSHSSASSTSSQHGSAPFSALVSCQLPSNLSFTSNISLQRAIRGPRPPTFDQDRPSASPSGCSTPPASTEQMPSASMITAKPYFSSPPPVPTLPSGTAGSALFSGPSLTQLWPDDAALAGQPAWSVRVPAGPSAAAARPTAYISAPMQTPAASKAMPVAGSAVTPQRSTAYNHIGFRYNAHAQPSAGPLFQSSAELYHYHHHGPGGSPHVRNATFQSGLPSHQFQPSAGTGWVARMRRFWGQDTTV